MYCNCLVQKKLTDTSASVETCDANYFDNFSGKRANYRQFFWYTSHYCMQVVGACRLFADIWTKSQQAFTCLKSFSVNFKHVFIFWVTY